jgi:dipeptidyl-peptidase-4
MICGWGPGERFWYRRAQHAFRVGEADLSLPTDHITWTSDGIEYHSEGHLWRWVDGRTTDLGPVLADTCRSDASPDGQWYAVVRQHDLYLVGPSTIRLTHDGSPEDGYGLPRPYGETSGLQAAWSPSGRLAAVRVDTRRARRYQWLQSVVDGRPIVHEYVYPLPGDPDVPQARIEIFADGRRVAVTEPRFLTITPLHIWWYGERLLVLTQPRGYQGAWLGEIDPATGEVSVLHEERFDHRFDLHAYQSVPQARWRRDGTRMDTHLSPHNVRLLRGGKDILWYSQRDGWGHLYIGDRPVTSGRFMVHDVLHTDDAAETILFTAGGREPGRDPYYRHLYRVRYDGTELALLTPEDCDHEISVSPSGQRFADMQSRVDMPPRVVLSTGRVLEEMQAPPGYRPPERFRARSADGAHDVYGILVFPRDFSPARRYPVVDDVYPGPHCIHCPKAFPMADADPAESVWASNGRQFWRAQALADLGFVVLMMDGTGSALREWAFQAPAYRNLRHAGGIVDHIAALRQLAESRPYLDLERVGIDGISAGGYTAARAILDFPEFYKVAVAAAGNHDIARDKAVWVERYQGLLTEETAAQYRLQDNATVAHRLAGHLLLAHGDIDDNVHPGLTLALCEALLKAGKPYDLLIMPNHRHPLREDPEYIRRVHAYFVQHLGGLHDPDRLPDPPARHPAESRLPGHPGLRLPDSAGGEGRLA